MLSSLKEEEELDFLLNKPLYILNYFGLTLANVHFP